MERTIRLNERELKGITNECVNEYLTENIDEVSRNAKERNQKNIENVFKKGIRGYNAIKSLAVFTAETPIPNTKQVVRTDLCKKSFIET